MKGNLCDCYFRPLRLGDRRKRRNKKIRSRRVEKNEGSRDGEPLFRAGCDPNEHFN